jgi:hypothetical protein
MSTPIEAATAALNRASKSLEDAEGRRDGTLPLPVV